MKLENRAVLVTGGGSGIGREIALAFAREGARLGVNDVRREPAHRVVRELAESGARDPRAFIADVSDSSAVKEMFAQFLAAFGTIDVLVNNAGISHARATPALTSIAEATDEEWHKMLATHLDATFYCTREALKVMIPRRSGRIINVASVAGIAGLAGASEYSAAKGGVIAFTKAVAREVAAQGILVNCIAPGFIDTPMTEQLGSARRKQVTDLTPLGRFGVPREIAAAALFFASDDGSFMVGQVISPNGGFTI